MIIYVLYKAINLVNQKAYIGYTQNYRKRKQSHLTSKDSYLFHKALRKYSSSNFIWGILDWTDSLTEAKLLEIKYIVQYQTYYKFGKGYNMTKGGEGFNGNKHSLISKNKMRQKALRRKFSLETLKKISKSIQQFCAKPEERRKRQERQKGAKGSNAKQWQLISPQGEIFEIAGTLKLFCKEKGLPYATICKSSWENKIPERGKAKGWKVICIGLHNLSSLV